MTAAIALLSGLLFGLGLLLSGMAQPAKVLGFLDLAGQWDPSLALVMASAIAVALPAFARARRHSAAWNGDRIAWPANARVDTRLLIGGVLFGAGWGLAGYCPGPALVAASSGSLSALGFVAAMLVGMRLHDGWRARH